ncbi:MAG TPA: hypothetical protein VG672_17280, partial [Bryobacteraceae bacterium]|nr:hypothetical protein [Bryobacteraceae bacterium]
IEIRQAGHWQDKARSSWYEINVQLRTPTRKLELTPLARNPAGGQVGYADDKHHGLDNLLAELMKNFDGALSSFERAAGITDPDRQLSVEAHFHRLSSSELTARIAEEDRLAKENERIEKEKEKAQKKGGGGWGLLGAIALGAAEGVSGGGADSPILQAGAAQAAAIRAIGNRNAGAQSVPAGNSASSAAAGQSIQMQTQQDSPSSAVVKVPPAYAPAPINIHFQNTPNFTLGHAHVTSTPSGIDCPGVCSYSFGRGGNVSLQAVADQNSIVRSMSCDMSGSSAPFRPGNSDTCAYPFADGGGTVVVYVDAVNSAPQSGGNTSITSNGSGKQGTAGHPGVGLTSRGPMAAPNETQSCTDMSKFVTATVKTGSDDIVYGYVTNHSDQTLSISVTFATGGKPNKDQAAMVTVGPGKTLGGSGGGIWATTSAVDHNPPEIFWYAVPQSEVNRLCVEPF